MNQAQREIQRLVEQFTTAKHGQVDGGVERYAEQFGRDLEAVVAKHGAKKEVVRVLPNGLKKVRVLDQRGELVAEYTEA